MPNWRRLISDPVGVAADRRQRGGLRPRTFVGIVLVLVGAAILYLLIPGIEVGGLGGPSVTIEGAGPDAAAVKTAIEGAADALAVQGQPDARIDPLVE